MKKIISLIATILCVVFTLTACGDGSGLEAGFFGSGGTIPAIMAGAKSDKTDFNLDDITLDFYYGSNGSRSWGVTDTNYELVGFVVYFCNAKYLKTINGIQTIIDDYNSIDGFYFVKEISKEEYTSGDYNVEVKTFSGSKYQHKETLTVPSEVIELSNGEFSLVIMEMLYSQSADGYCVNQKGYVLVRYEIIDEQTVRLSDGGTVPNGPS